MLFGGKQEKKTEDLIQRHIELVGEVVDAMNLAAQDYCTDCAEFDERAKAVMKGETQADAVRREIERELYDGAFMPLQRGDYATMVELIDKVANQCEAVAQFMFLTRPELSEETQRGLIDIMEATVECYSHMPKMFEQFDDGLAVLELSHEVEVGESKVDKLFAENVSGVFDSDIDLARKILIKMLLDRTAAISNRIEDASDRFCTMVSKRP